MFRETDYFQLWILYKIDLRISTAEEHMGNLRFKLLKKKKFSRNCVSCNHVSTNHICRLLTYNII